MRLADGLGLPEPLRLSETASITVTFNPDIDILKRQLRSLEGVGVAIVIDNGSHASLSAALVDLAASMPRVRIICSAHNEGLATAINRGIAEMKTKYPGAKAMLLLDQDSVFAPSAPAALLDALNAVQKRTNTLCCVGPSLEDPGNGMTHGFHHVAGGWRWARMHPEAHSEPCAVSTLNGSGTMMPLALVDTVGGMEDAFFIDHIDTEWSFRVASYGGGLFGVPSVTFEHRMGEAGRRIWLLGWRLWPERSPLRHYYLFRNTMRLLLRGYVPRVWKVWAVAKLLLTMAVTCLIDVRRHQQLKQMVRGIREGSRG